MEEYLKLTEIIDCQHPDIISKANELASGKGNLNDIARSCFDINRVIYDQADISDVPKTLFNE